MAETTDAASLSRRLDEVQVLDVREPDEWEAGRIEDAVHIPLGELPGRLDELDRDRPVVAVCQTGARSARAADLLASRGFAAANLDGGLKAWEEAGLPTVAGDDPTPPELRELEAGFLELVFAVQEHFGDREPSDEEVMAFLRDRLIAEGHTPEEADHFLATMHEGLGD